MKHLHLLLIITLPLINLMACGGGGGSSDDGADQQTESNLEGLAECLPQAGSAVVCGSVLAADGITPLVNAEVTLSTTGARLSNRTPVAFRGVADPDKCITDYSGEFACLLPSGVSGNIDLVISLAGFDDNIVNTNAMLDETVELSQVSLTSNSNNRWVVIPGEFDGVQVLLAQLKGCTLNDEYGNPFDAATTSAEFARGSTDCENKGLIVLDIDDATSVRFPPTYIKSAEFDNNDALFVNCPEDYSYDAEANQAVQDFVEAGNHAYFSDQSDTWLTAIFPGKVNFAGSDTSIGGVSATVTHSGLSSVVGNSLDIAFDLFLWTAIDTVDSDVTTFLEADISTVSDYTGVHPITVGWKDSSSGAGCVFYTSYHIEGASSGSDQELAMKYLVQNINTVCN
ncbi:MAG: hypothetical protein ABW098_06650 [Candidatus Thiodiazotropha sp.]